MEAETDGSWHDADREAHSPGICDRPLIRRAECFAERNVAHAAIGKTVIRAARRPGACRRARMPTEFHHIQHRAGTQVDIELSRDRLLFAEDNCFRWVLNMLLTAF